MSEYTLKDVIYGIESMAEELELMNRNNSNSWGQSIGDELHQIEYQLGRIADSLEKIADK
jgi:hypothetical protein